MKIPGQSNGTKIRFTFDAVSDAANSAVYIEGTQYSDNSLRNVTYNGLSSGNGQTIEGTVDGIFVTYTFEDVKLTSGADLPTNNIHLWGYITSTSIWSSSGRNWYVDSGSTFGNFYNDNSLYSFSVRCRKSE